MQFCSTQLRSGFPDCLRVMQTNPADNTVIIPVKACSLTINRLMLQNNCRDWHNVQQTIDRFIRAGLQEFLQDGE